MIHRLGDDDRHHTVRVGDLLRVARLQRRQRRPELTLLVHKAEYVGDIADRQLLIEAVLLRSIVVGLGPTPGKLLALAVVIEVFQLALAQLKVERQPLLVEFARQRIEADVDWLAKPGDVHLLEHVRLLVDGDEFVGEATVL